MIGHSVALVLYHSLGRYAVMYKLPWWTSAISVNATVLSFSAVPIAFPFYPGIFIPADKPD